jgi:hypothetical protein
MNNNNTSAILRSLIVYAVCVPLAIFVGYSLANPTDLHTLTFYGFLGAVLASPLFLRWHREILVFSWAASISVFILPGTPNLWLVMVCISLAISILERILSSNMQFIRVPQVTVPLMAFLLVVVFTAELTGGMGMKAFGSSIYGGKKYFYLLLSVASYFALTARPIPREKAGLFATLFCTGCLTNVIGNFYPITPRWLSGIYLIFPPTLEQEGGFQLGVTRLSGFGTAGTGLYMLLMIKYGVRGVLLGGKLWRPVLLFLCVILAFLGGFRSTILLLVATFLFLFFWEGLHRTPLFLVMILGALAGGTALIPLAHKLPWTFQRSLSFLPLDWDADAKGNADDSTDWRLRMWTALLPQIPPHLLLGKGLAFSPGEFDEMMSGNLALEANASGLDAADNPLALSADYHNGMLSLVIPFGVWGVATVLWFLSAGTWVLYRNAKYAPDELKLANSLLFAAYLWEALNFISCIAGLQIAAELAYFVGYLGLSIALNNGVCRPPPRQSAPYPSVLPFRALPRPRPAFQR